MAPRVNVVITAKDKASKAFKTFRKSLAGIKSAATSVATGIAGITATALGAVIAVGKLAEKGREYVGIQRAFARVTTNSRAALTELRQATGGLISDIDLMRGFNQALALGSAKTIGDFGTMAQAAISLGQALGVDMAKSLESLSTGIARQSNQWLDNIAIQVRAKDANDSYARSIGKLASQLTEAERKEAFRVAAIEAAKQKAIELGRSNIVAADSYTRMRVVLESVADRFTSMIALSPQIAAFFDAIRQKAEGLLLVVDSSGDVPKAFTSLGKMAGLSFVDGFAGVIQAYFEGVADTIQNGSTFDRVLGFWVARINRGIASAAGSIREQIGGALSSAANEFSIDVESARLKLEALGSGAVGNLPSKPPGPPSPPRGRFVPDLPRLNASLLFGPNPIDTARIGLARRDAPTPIIPGGSISFTPSGAGAFGLAQNPQSGLPSFMQEMSRDFRSWLIRARDDAEEVAQEIDASKLIAVSAFGAMAEAAVSGSEQMSRAVIGGITQILQSVAQKQSSFLNLGGFGVPIIGAVGGILGGIFGRNKRPSVEIESFSSTAERQLKDNNPGPETVTLTIVSPQGRVLDEISAHLNRAESRDGTVRIPQNFTMGGS